MRIVILVCLLPLRLLAWSDSPDMCPTVSCSQSRDKDDPSSRVSKVMIKERSGKVLYDDYLTECVDNPVWTKDGQFLIMFASDSTPGHAKTPWRYSVYIFSRGDKQWRVFRGSEDTPIISSEIWTQDPDGIVLIGHRMQSDIPPPDDPILLRYKVCDLWKQLENH
jgi:hypothetical protein